MIAELLGSSDVLLGVVASLAAMSDMERDFTTKEE